MILVGAIVEAVKELTDNERRILLKHLYGIYPKDFEYAEMTPNELRAMTHGTIFIPDIK